MGCGGSGALTHPQDVQKEASLTSTQLDAHVRGMLHLGPEDELEISPFVFLLLLTSVDNSLMDPVKSTLDVAVRPQPG
jgi:hypothetical protein